MAKKGAILNTFQSGMTQDFIPERQPVGTYTYALNMMSGSSEHIGMFTNEESNLQFNLENIPGTVMGVSHFAKVDQSVVFVSDGGASSLYVVYHNTGATELVITDSDFGCNWNFGGCEMLYGEMKLLQPCNDRVVYFSSDCNYYLVNIDEVLSERKNCIKSCEHFKLMRCICTPKASPFPVEGGGFIRAGAYWVTLQLEDNDGNTTNWFPISGPVYIGSENNIAGEISNTSIRIYVDEIDTGYEKVNIGIIKKIAGIVTAELVVSRSHGNTAFTHDYTGDNADAEQLSLDEILNRGKKYIRGSDLFQKDGILYLYGIRQEFNVNYQKHANKIKVRAVEFEVTAETQKEYNLPSLMRDEVYGVVGWLNFCDGTKSRGFHVPAGASGGSGDSIMTDPYASTAGGNIVVPSTTPPVGAPSEQIIPYASATGDDWDAQGPNTWIQATGPEPSNMTGPDSGEYMIARATGNLGETLRTQSPAIDLRESTRPTISFETYMYGAAVSEIRLEVSTDGKNWSTIWSRSGNQGRGWLASSATLQAFAGSWIQLAFISSPQENLGDIAIRNIGVVNASAITQDTGANQQYSDGTYDTSKTFNRGQGNPDDDGRELEDAISKDIDDINCADEEKAKKAIDEFADYFGVDNVCTTDLDQASDMLQNISEETAEFTQDEIPPKLGTSNTIKEAAQNLYEKGIKNREYEKRGKAEWDFKKNERYQATLDNEEAKAPRSDNWTTSTGVNLLPEKPRIISIFEPGIYESEIPYPDTCDCDGKRMYPEGNIRHHHMPNNCQSTHYISNQIGVPSKFDPANSPLGDTYIRLLGFEFDNIYIPREDEVPKPLCPHNPITFGILKRDLNDRSIIAKGLLVATFTGNIRGREHAMGKHGVNSFEVVDVAIDDEGSKIGINDSPNAYLFHSLDTSCQRIPLAVTDLSPQLELFGSGWRYGLYAEGEKPEQWYTGKRVDQRGARQAISLMGQIPICKTAIGGDGTEDLRSVEGITYAPGNTVVTPPKGITLPLNNRFRESSVYLQLGGKMPSLLRGIGGESDSSFVGDTLDHSCPIAKAASWYVGLKRELLAQYGSVENQKAVTTGILVLDAAPGSTVSVMGITGDIFIGLHSIKRSSYISDKVGEKFPVRNGASDGRRSIWKRERSICDHPANGYIQNVGMDHWPTRLPESGDVDDAKNWAGLHTTNVVYSCEDAAKRTAPDTDYYYPRVQKTVLWYVGEFEVNPYKRATGVGSQIVEGKVHLENLKDLSLDSSASEDVPWPEGWLNRFYVMVEQPSKAVLAKKAMIRTLLVLILPAMGALISTQIESIPDSILTLVVMPMVVAYWMYAKVTLFTDDWLNKMFGIPICKTDEEGGEDYVRVVKYEDNYCRYHREFSERNDFEFALGIPSNYNTCVCNECDSLVTREIYYSNKQVETSIIDSYRNFQAHNYSAIPAHAGPLLKLFVESNRFYGHTSDGMWILQYNNVTGQIDGITAILGKGDLLRDPQQLNEGAREGYFGLADKNASISCGAGYVFVSRPSGDIIRLQNGKVDVITLNGMYNFFQENLRFCNPKDCVDERQGVDFVLGYDPRHKRLLITKRDGDDCSSWTISYHLMTKTWTSFHSYIPRFYIWDQKNLYSIEKNNIWIHNQQRRLNGDKMTWCTFYGRSYPVIIDFVTRHESAEPWMYSSTIVDMDVQVQSGGDWLRARHTFFDKLAAWNSTQATGLLPVSTRQDNPSNENDVVSRLTDTPARLEANYANHQWRINDIADYLENCNGAVTKKKCLCSPVLEIMGQGKKIVGQQNIKDRYLFYRLVASNPAAFKIYLKSVITEITMQSE